MNSEVLTFDAGSFCTCSVNLYGRVADEEAFATIIDESFLEFAREKEEEQKQLEIPEESEPTTLTGQSSLYFHDGANLKAFLPIGVYDSITQKRQLTIETVFNSSVDIGYLNGYRHRIYDIGYSAWNGLTDVHSAYGESYNISLQMDRYNECMSYMHRLGTSTVYERQNFMSGKSILANKWYYCCIRMTQTGSTNPSSGDQSLSSIYSVIVTLYDYKEKKKYDYNFNNDGLNSINVIGSSVYTQSNEIIIGNSLYYHPNSSIYPFSPFDGNIYIFRLWSHILEDGHMSALISSSNTEETLREVFGKDEYWLRDKLMVDLKFNNGSGYNIKDYSGKNVKFLFCNKNGINEHDEQNNLFVPIWDQNTQLPF